MTEILEMADQFEKRSAIYRMVQNFDRRNIDEFDKFSAIRQYFSYQNFPFS